MNRSKVKPAASSVEFATEARVHVGIGVRDLEASVGFYDLLFEQPPTKRKDNYAKYEVERSPVNLALNQIAHPAARDSVSHFGIQVKHQEEIVDAHQRFQAAGYPTKLEESVACCYAVQHKTWLTDPDGNKWEIFMVLEDSQQYSPGREGECCVTEDQSPCCDEETKAQGCCG